MWINACIYVYTDKDMMMMMMMMMLMTMTMMMTLTMTMTVISSVWSRETRILFTLFHFVLWDIMADYGHTMGNSLRCVLPRNMLMPAQKMVQFSIVKNRRPSHASVWPREHISHVFCNPQGPSHERPLPLTVRAILQNLQWIKHDKNQTKWDKLW